MCNIKEEKIKNNHVEYEDLEFNGNKLLSNAGVCVQRAQI